MSEKVGSGNGIIFGGGCVAFVSGHEFNLNASQKFCPSRQGSRAWKQNLIHEFRCELWPVARAKDGEERESVNSRRGALLLRVYFLRETIKGRSLPGMLSRLSFAAVLMLPVFGEPIKLTSTQHAQFTRACTLISTAAKVFLTSIESASRCTHHQEMARWPLSNFYSLRHDPHGLVSPVVDIYAHPLRIVVTPTVSLSLIPDSPALDNRCHLRFRWHPKIVSAECARIKILRVYNRK